MKGNAVPIVKVFKNAQNSSEVEKKIKTVLDSYLNAKPRVVVQLTLTKNCCQQMTDFMAKMHKIGIRLGLRPRPRSGSLLRPQSTRPLAVFGGLLLREEEGGVERRERRGGKVKEGEGIEESVPIVPVLRNDHW